MIALCTLAYVSDDKNESDRRKWNGNKVRDVSKRILRQSFL